ncbi:GSCOCT00014270001.2-RA-CDS [Cotesia congregata]|uniref:Cc_bv8.6_15.4b_pseudo n=1 Tax=Cotesia congregata TaxID=51543 RepID=A0A8J2HB30_COTCN|nr:GSCOCT00014270001.2-RA-CDS [Cotesia congregata]CAG5092511.1 cc_bv8.6_15.4b_pseudo [Cotesia congregata]
MFSRKYLTSKILYSIVVTVNDNQEEDKTLFVFHFRELADAFRCDTALPKDLYSVKINFASGNQSCNELR